MAIKKTQQPNKGGRPKKVVPTEKQKTIAKACSRETAAPLHPYQQRWVCDTSRFKIGLWARQTGKSFSTALEAVLDCQEYATDWIFLSSGERQAKELIRKARMHSEAMDIALNYDEGEYIGSSGIIYKQLEILFPNGSRIMALPANPDTARGHSANLVLDEFAFHKDSREIWKALFPTISRGFKLRVISTPQGKKNKFYEIWTGNQHFSKHQTDIWSAWREGLVIYGNDFEPASPEFLREALDDEEAWSQEYLIEFLDEATAFITYEMISACEDSTLSMENPLDPGSYVVAGIDVGRKKDFTVYWSLEVSDLLKTVTIHAMQNLPFSDQEAQISGLIEREQPSLVHVDYNSLGMYLCERLQERFGGRIVPVNLTLQSKQEMAAKTKAFFEDALLRIPVDRRIRESIHSIKRVVSPAGNIRFDADRTKDGHGDFFWALALAIQGHEAAIGIPDIVLGPGSHMAQIISPYEDKVMTSLSKFH